MRRIPLAHTMNVWAISIRVINYPQADVLVYVINSKKLRCERHTS